MTYSLVIVYKGGGKISTERPTFDEALEEMTAMLKRHHVVTGTDSIDRIEIVGIEQT